MPSARARPRLPAPWSPDLGRSGRWSGRSPRRARAKEASFRNIKFIAECLADELINAAKGSSNSHLLLLS